MNTTSNIKSHCSQLERFSMVYVLHLSLLGTYVASLYKPTEITLRYQVPFFNKSLFELLESLWWNRKSTNTSVKPIPHKLDGIKVGTHCWAFHLLNVQFSQDSSGDGCYVSPGIVVHEYEFRANTLYRNQHML